MYHLFCGFKNAQKPPHVCVLHKRCPSKCCKICRKARVLESIFNKVKLATLLKKTLRQVFSCEFFEIIKGDFFIKHLRVSASECWRLEKSSWLLVKDIIFQLSEVSLRIAVVIYGFLSACGKRMFFKRSFLTIHAQQNLKGCVAWALLSISVGWVGCYAKYLIFKNTS